MPKCLIHLTALTACILIGSGCAAIDNHAANTKTANTEAANTEALNTEAANSEGPAVAADVRKSTVQVEFAPGFFDLPRASFDKWIANAEKAVTTYYGHFPVRSLLIKIRPDKGENIGFATADYEGKTAVIELPVGTHIQSSTLEKDWVLTHEMTHLAFPLMDDEHRWVAEGMATYIEPIARLQIHTLPPEKIWKDLIDNLDQGQPQSGDKGLNNTHTWGRTYWGGALFCLLADIQLRKETHNKFGLQDAVRAILNDGGNVASDWTVEEALASGDKATGTKVLQSLYGQMKDKPVKVDLDNLWSELGAEELGDRVIFDDNAPFAAIRLAINKGHI